MLTATKTQEADEVLDRLLTVLLFSDKNDLITLRIVHICEITTDKEHYLNCRKLSLTQEHVSSPSTYKSTKVFYHTI